MPNPSITLTREQVLRLLDGHPIQAPTSLGLLEFTAVPGEWTPLRKIRPPRRMIDAHARAGLPTDFEVWANDIYEAIVTQLDGITHLSIKRYDRAALHNWRHLQQIKNEVCGESREGIELYPSESRLADNANQYHLWVLPEGHAIPFGFQGRMVTSDEEVEAWNQGDHPGRQEPWEPGLTVGGDRSEGTGQDPNAVFKGGDS